MHSPTLRRALFFKVTAPICVAIICCLFVAPAASGQSSVLVTSQYSELSVLDLTLQNLTESVPGARATRTLVVDPNNPRLAYVSAGAYVSVIDLTIGREVNRIEAAFASSFLAFSRDGKYLLLADNGYYTLDIIDLARQTLVRRVNLLTAMGSNAQQGAFGSVVVVGNKAYVTTMITDNNRPAIAVVDLKTFKTRPIALPAAGYFDGCCNGSPNAAATPDGKYVVMGQALNSDGSEHLYFISTATNRVVLDVPQTSGNGIYGVLASPINNPGSNYGYLLSGGSASVIDLNFGSPTLGQVVSSTTVNYASYFTLETAAAISPDGVYLVVGGFKGFTATPNPNVVELDTGLMRTSPGTALLHHGTANGGTRPFGIAVAPITTTPPLTAPTVATVSGPITNDTVNTVTVTGTNFAPGATVRIGTMQPLPATVGSSTSLTVTVPQNAPFRVNQDVVVTNPNVPGDPGLRYQSRLKPAVLTIQPNSNFLPQNLFGSLRTAAQAVSVFDPTHNTMVDDASGLWAGGIAFNADGASVYGFSGSGQRGHAGAPQLVAWDPATLAVKAQIPFTGAGFSSVSQTTDSAIAATVNPLTGNPTVYVPLRKNSSGTNDLVVELIDTDSSSPGINTITGTLSAGLNVVTPFFQVWACAATPDGKYVYVNYSYTVGTNTVNAMGIFNVLGNTFTSIPTATLGIAQQQHEMHVTPDGKSLLVTGMTGNPSAGPVAVLDISQQPINPVLVTTISGNPPPYAGAFYFYSFQTVGNRLFALDTTTASVVAFNFDRSTLSFGQLGLHALDHPAIGLAVSPDGSLVYIAEHCHDTIAVLDAVKLANNQPSLVTNVGTYPGVTALAVSPAAITATQLQVTTASLPTGTQGVAYSASLAASGGTPPYTWVVSSGNLPSGLTLTPYGAISGTPSGAIATSNFTAKVTDSRGITADSTGLGISVQAGAALQITTASLPSGPATQAYYAALAATGGVPPYTWTVTSGGASLTALNLSVSTAGVITGTPARSGIATFTVQVADSAAPTPATLNAPLSITINGAGNTRLLSGHYAIQLSGFGSPGGQWAEVLSVVANGAGLITSGVFDTNSATGLPTNGTLTGTYTIDSAGLGLMTLTPSVGPTITLAFALSSSGSDRVIEYDTTGQRGSGVIRLQDASAFSLSRIHGTYVFGMVGADHLSNRYAQIGEAAVDGAGNVSNGLADFNDNGLSGSFTFTGTLSAVDPNTGRATEQVNIGQSHANSAVYVVSGTESLIIGIDSVQVTHNSLLSGSIVRQTGAGSFNNSSLTGTSVIQMQGYGNGEARSQLGLLTPDGAGNFAYQADQNQNGMLTQVWASGQYSVASNGRATTGNQGPILYLVGSNQGLVLDQGSHVSFGYFEPQATGPFSNASFSGTYAGGSLPAAEPNIYDNATIVSGDGNGEVVINQYASDSSGPSQVLGQTDSYNVAPNGRATTPDGTIIYVVSSTKIFVLDKSSDPSVQEYEH